MLRQTLPKLVTNSNTPNTLNSTCIARCNIPNIFRGTSAYSKNGSECDRTDATPKQADRAVAIFEKITRTDALINLLAGEISSELRENIVLNPDRNSKLRHIEVTADKIRLEYSQITPQFTKFASLMQANKQEQAQYPEFLVPTDAVNLTWCGGGATLVLSKRKTLHYLQQLKALHGVDEDKSE